MPDRKSIPYSMLHDALAGARAQGFDHDSLLLAVGVDPQRYPHTSGRLPLDQYAQLLRSLWKAMDDEAAGSLSRASAPGSFALMTQAALSADNLRGALRRCAAFFSITGDDLIWTLGERGDEAHLTLAFKNVHNLPPAYLLLTWFVLLIRFGSWLVNRPLLLHRISFTCPAPAYADEYPLMFPCTSYFAQPSNTLVFSRAILDQPVARDNKALNKFLADAPECLLTQFRTDDSYAGQVRLLLQSTDEQLSSLEHIAASLNTTDYTLRRRLKKEGTSFHDLRDSVLRQRAQDRLVHSGDPVAVIAAELGYSEPAAFNHAFKKWTGVTPGQYRKRGLSSKL